MNAPGSDRPEKWTLEGSRPGPLDVPRLERDLASMWKTATTRTGGTAVSRACSSTLAVLNTEEGAADADAWVQEISRRHPCWVLQVELRAGRDEPPEADAGAVCHLRPGAEGLICVEVIRVTAGADAAETLPSVVRSLAIGGLPLVLFAPEPAARDGATYARIAADADLTLVSSRTGADLDREDEDEVCDLAWSRGAPLRQALAAAGGAPAVRSAVESLRGIRIDHGGPPLAAAALLFAGWLCARLRLEPDERDGDAVRLRRGDTRVSLSLRAGGEDDDGPTGLSLDGGSGGPLELTLESACARVGSDDRRRTVALRRESRADRAIREIQRHAPDPDQRSALPIARRLRRILEEAS